MVRTSWWQEDFKSIEILQQAHGWTEEYCPYLDYLTTIDISYTAPWHQRHRYESTISLACNDEDRRAGPMEARKDFKPTPRILASLRQERRQQNSVIPKNERMRRRPFDEALRAELEWMSQNWKNLFLTTFPLCHLHKIGSNTNNKTLNCVNSKTLNGKITSGEITRGGKSES